MEWAIEKCTELGVTVIIPMIAARTEPHLAAAAPKRLERWRRLAHQASEQSRRISPPEIADPTKLSEGFGSSKRICELFFPRLRKIVRSKIRSRRIQNWVVLAFGPEGGWKEKEMAAFKGAGWKACIPRSDDSTG